MKVLKQEYLWVASVRKAGVAEAQSVRKGRGQRENQESEPAWLPAIVKRWILFLLHWEVIGGL